MNLTSLIVESRKLYWAAILWLCLGTASQAAVPCSQINQQKTAWVTQSVDSLVSAARAFFANEAAQKRYERVVNQIAGNIERCGLAHDRELAAQYAEFFEYLRLLSLGLDEDHELGFEVRDEVYFAETNKFTTIPDFLRTPRFLRAVSRFENLLEAKALLREMNAARAPGDQLIFFSYVSRHLGTPDNPNSYRRLLIVVPGDKTQGLAEKWVQFGIPDPRRPESVRNISVVAVVPLTDDSANVYFKDYFRTYRRNGSITIKGRWELGEGDDNCVSCHKSGVLPIFPVAGSVSHDEKPFVAEVNERFLNYGTARFDRYLDAKRFGPGLGSPRATAWFRQTSFSSPGKSPLPSCASCHHANELGALNWPMDSTLISSFVNGGQMPFGIALQPPARARLYRQLVDDYFAVDPARPGILQAWLLGKSR